MYELKKFMEMCHSVPSCQLFSLPGFVGVCFSFFQWQPFVMKSYFPIFCKQTELTGMDETCCCVLTAGENTCTPLQVWRWRSTQVKMQWCSISTSVNLCTRSRFTTQVHHLCKGHFVFFIQNSVSCSSTCAVRFKFTLHPPDLKILLHSPVKNKQTNNLVNYTLTTVLAELDHNPQATIKGTACMRKSQKQTYVSSSHKEITMRRW